MNVMCLVRASHKNEKQGINIGTSLSCHLPNVFGTAIPNAMTSSELVAKVKNDNVHSKQLDLLLTVIDIIKIKNGLPG